MGGSITVSLYSDAVKSSTVAGDVDISHNQVTAPSTYGILIFAQSRDSTRWGNNYKVIANTVLDANASNVSTVNYGVGIINTSGIAVGQGFNVEVANNSVIDTRAVPQMIYSVQIGQNFSPSAANEPDYVTVTNNRISGYVTGKVKWASPTSQRDGASLLTAGRSNEPAPKPVVRRKLRGEVLVSRCADESGSASDRTSGDRDRRA